LLEPGIGLVSTRFTLETVEGVVAIHGHAADAVKAVNDARVAGDDEAVFDTPRARRALRRRLAAYGVVISRRPITDN
jgi:hypothetical protein